MKLPLLCLFILTFSHSVGLCTKSSVYSNLSYFFQEPDADLPMVKVYEKKIQELITGLHKYDQNSKKKRIDRISNDIEAKFFKQYKNDANLADLFVYGYHNAISARAIQAIVLTELEIPFILAEQGEILTLTTYPESEKINVEYSTKLNTLAWTEETKTTIINYLIEMEVVSRSQANRYGYELIEKHFGGTNSISIQELAGLHLMKKGILLIGSSDFLKAVEILKIGKMNYSDNRFNYLMFGAMNLGIDDLTFDDILIMDYLTTLYDLTGKRATLDRLKNNIKLVYRIALNERNDLVYADSSKALAKSNITQESRQKIILSDFLMIEMYYYAIQRNSEKSFECAVNGLALNPKNIEIQNVFGSLVLENLFYGENWIYEDLDIDDRVDSLDYYIQAFPFLSDSKEINEFYIATKCDEISVSFNNNQLQTGLKLLSDLEQLINDYNYKESKINQTIASTYSDIATFYYREKNYTVAFEWIEKAVSIYPNSESINVRKKNIEAKL